MKKRLSLLAAALFILLAACSQTASIPSPEKVQILQPPPQPLKFEIASLGFNITVLDNMQMDDSYQPYYIRFSNHTLDLKISKEKSPYADLDSYFNKYIYKYLLNETFHKANVIKLLEHTNTTINGYKTKIVALSRDAADPAVKDYYYQAIMVSNKKDFYMLNFKTSDPDQDTKIIKDILNSFKVTEAAPKSFALKFKPDPSALGGEALEFYNNLRNANNVQWGIFYPASLKPFEKFKEIEQKINYKFPVMLHYIYLGSKFPKDTLQQAHENGKIVELTMQTMWSVLPEDTADNKNTMHSTVYDIIDGEYDAYLRNFAKELKAFKHPVLFRLNNEMNGTWTVYSGIASMCDPDVYIQAWRHIYELFEEQQVDNAIWIFNPNDRDYPPLNWNNQVCYYPGDGYVQLIGVTGYNTGNYFQKKTGETWRSFNQIFRHINDRFSVMYSDYPWIVTEFASNSVGGSKQAWIKEMFDSMHNYPNIKIAVWWSYFDPDPETKKPARKYWLDEKEEYLMEFKRGLERTD
ncbi:MAG: endoglucanase [Clostridia bacterium]|nr:endoglucanase [Clostridia bacterium]